ncbi:hypothetical protein ASZ90_004797 [hydrocarbon metagenome]|uniref:Uncharacterized protein n=1 Tax=hydrocarbon metagenome TaxID=938273 RepID=A0A0W8FX11_9ZZZZ
MNLGVIQDDITSTIMFYLFLGIADNLFHPNSYARTLNTEIVNRKYVPINRIIPQRRLREMADNSFLKDKAPIDVSVFTKRDMQKISNSTNYHELINKVHKVTNLDRPIAHFLGLPCLPRSVFFVHQSQYDNFNDEIKKFLLHWEKAVDNYSRRDLLGGIKPLKPSSKQERNSQNLFIRAAKQFDRFSYLNEIDY